MLVGLKMGEAADRVKVVLVGETADTLKSVPLYFAITQKLIFCNN